MVAAHGFSKKFADIFFVFIASLAASSLLGVLGGLLLSPGSGISPETQRVIGQLLSDSEAVSRAPTAAQTGLFDLLKEMIPINPIAALSQGKHLSILFFSIVLGVALGFGNPASLDLTLRVAETLYHAQLKIISWTLRLLPIGLFFIFSDQIAHSGTQVLFALTRFIVSILLIAILMMLLQVGVVWRRSGRTLANVLTGLKEVIFVAFVSRSSFASIPSAIEALHSKLGRDQTDVNLVIPLSINLARHGTSFYLALASVFMAQMYHLQLGFHHNLIIWVLGVLAGMIPAEIASLIPLVFAPLGLPIGVGILLLLAIDLIVDPFLTVCNVLGSCASTVFLSKKGDAHA